MLTLILGGARSGKSRFAQQLCSRQSNVTYVATALVNDEEMRARIERHRADRPAGWQTIEEPLCLARAVERAASDSGFVLVDCLTLWLSNFCWSHKQKAESEIQRLASSEIETAVAAGQHKNLIFVSNEVGSSIIPENSVARSFRDIQGFINQRAAAAADEVFLTVAGIPLRIKPQAQLQASATIDGTATVRERSCRGPFQFAFLLLLTALSAWTQNSSTITGTVRDPQKATVPGAHIRLEARDNTSNIEAITNSAGRYQFENVAPGNYLLQASAPGFSKSAIQLLETQPGQKSGIDFSLDIATVATNVIVTASGTPQTTDELSKSVSVLDAHTLDQRDDSSLSEALRILPGLKIQRLGGPVSDSSIRTRGLPAEDTAILVDGFRFRDSSTTQGDASSFIEDMVVTDVDRIEVLRGAGSSLYGSNATGGVVNIVTSEGGGRTRGSLLLEGGSLGTFRGRAEIAGGAKNDRLQYTLGVSHLDVVDGIDGDYPARVANLQGRISYNLSPTTRVYGRIFAADTFSTLSIAPEAIGTLPASTVVSAAPLSAVQLRSYEQGTPASDLNVGSANFIPSANDGDSTRASRFFSGVLGLSMHPTESLGITLDYQGLRTWRRFGDGPAGPGFQPTGSDLSFYDGEINTLQGRLDWQLGHHQTIDAGYEFENENFSSHFLLPDPTQNSQTRVTQRSNSAFAQDQFHLFNDRLQLAGSYRLQAFTLTTPGFTPASSAPYSGLQFAAPPTAQTGDGSAAWFFRKSGTKIRSHVGRGYRAPSLYERFGVYYSSFGYSAFGDPRLQPERFLSADAGVDQNFWSGRGQISATYFYTQLQSVIVFDTQGIITPASDPFGRYGGYFNTHGGLARGVELSGSIKPTKSTTITPAYTYTDGRERTPLSPGVWQTYRIPKNMFSAMLTQRLSARATVIFTWLDSSGYLSPVYDPGSFQNRAYQFPGMNQGQLAFNYRVPLSEFRAVRFFARADDLWNQRYYESGYRTPGITGMGGMQFEF